MPKVTRKRSSVKAKKAKKAVKTPSRKPVAGKPRKPPARKPVAKKPAARKPVAKKSPARKPVAKKPATRKSSVRERALERALEREREARRLERNARRRADRARARAEKEAQALRRSAAARKGQFTRDLRKVRKELLGDISASNPVARNELMAEVKSDGTTWEAFWRAALEASTRHHVEVDEDFTRKIRDEFFSPKGE